MNIDQIYKKNRICIINCYWGPWPKWFSFFIESCKFNSEINWILFSDNSEILHPTENVRFIELPINDFNAIASSKLNFQVNIKDPYKVCDFRPAYGKIFEDYLKDFDFWGYCDIDLIFGNIKEFITDEILEKYDVISSYLGFFSGPFCLIKNRTYTNLLYKKIENFKQVLQSSDYIGLDENIFRKDRKGISFDKIIIAFLFLPQYFFSKPTNYFALKETRYQFQWFYKKLKTTSEKIIDISEAIYYFTKKKKIKSYFKELLISDKHYERIQKNDWKLIWENGELIEDISNQKLLGFHFIGVKNKYSFSISKELIYNKKFVITKNGIDFT